MQYKNNKRKIGLTGLMRVKDDAETLAQSIDSCIDALDELIITYNDCTDGSVQIIENKKLQYSEKILVIPYSYHVFGVDSSVEEYEYAKTLPVGHPQLLASYYNNALQYANFKYVMKIDADQIYYTEKLKTIREKILSGVDQKALGRLFGKLVNYFCQKRNCKRVRSKHHILHWLQNVIVPLFRKQYVNYALSELLKGNGYLSLSGVNVLKYNKRWYAPVGCKWEGGLWWSYMGAGDHLVFEADEHTEYFPWDYTNGKGKQVLIERFEFPEKKTVFMLGFYWFHLKQMKKPLYDQCVSCYREHPNSMIPVGELSTITFNRLLNYLDKDNDYHYLYRRNFFNFVHILDKKSIKTNITQLNKM